jgi:subtilase family serine protease
VVDTASVVRLAAGESRTLTLSGPACGTRARVEVDPDRLIAETAEDDNVHELACS